MAASYVTISARGQIAIPGAIRRQLGLLGGKKVAARVDAGQIIEPLAIESVRERLRSSAQRAGTWGTRPTAEDGWAARAEEIAAKP